MQRQGEPAAQVIGANPFMGRTLLKKSSRSGQRNCGWPLLGRKQYPDDTSTRINRDLNAATDSCVVHRRHWTSPRPLRGASCALSLRALLSRAPCAGGSCVIS